MDGTVPHSVTVPTWTDVWQLTRSQECCGRVAACAALSVYNLTGEMGAPAGPARALVDVR